MGATRYTARLGRLGDQDIVVLTDVDGGRCVRIARHGAALLGFEADVDGATRDLADGYGDAAEITQRAGSRFAIMAPFAGRVADARYDFDGQSQDLAPGRHRRRARQPAWLCARRGFRGCQPGCR